MSNEENLNKLVQANVGDMIEIEGDIYKITMNKQKIDPITRKPQPRLTRVG